jgi:hypothetical protein
MSMTTPAPVITTPVSIKTTSPRGTLSTEDWLKSLLAAVVTPVIPIVTETLNNGLLTFNWKAIGAAALLGFVAYIGNALANSSKTIISGVQPGATINLTVPPVGTPTTATQTK